MLGLAAITALGAVLRFATLGDQSFSYDEYVTVSHLALGFKAMLHEVIHGLERTPPLYYAVAWFWQRPFGSGEVGLRSLSALAGTAFIPVVYVATTQLASRRAGLVAAALAAVSPLLVWYSEEARAYALLSLFGALSFLFFVRALSDRGPRVLGAWALFSTLAMATHFYVWVLTGLEAVWLLAVSGGDRRRVALAVLPQAATAAILLPLTSSQKGGSNWVAGLPFGERLAEVPSQFLFAYADPPAWLVAIGSAAVAVALLLAARLVLAPGEDRGRRGVLIAGAVLLGCIVLALLESVVAKDLFLARYLLFLWLPAVVVLAAGLGAGRAGIGGGLAATVLCGVLLASTIRVASTDSLQRADWREVAERIGPADAPRMITAPSVRQSRPLAIYLANARLIEPWERAQPRVAELYVIQLRERPGPADRLCWWEGACVLADAAESPAPPPPGFRLTDSRRVGLFTLNAYRSRRARAVAASRFGDQRSVFVQRPGAST